MGLFRRLRARPAAGAAFHAAPLNESERAWLAGHLERLRTSGVDVADIGSLSSRYDELLGRWLSAPDDLRPDPNPDITMIGIGLGEYLRRQTAVLDWAVVADAASTEMALHGQPGDILVYPANAVAVAKRWTSREYGFLPAFAADTVDAVARIRLDSAPG